MSPDWSNSVAYVAGLVVGVALADHYRDLARTVWAGVRAAMRIWRRHER